MAAGEARARSGYSGPYRVGRPRWFMSVLRQRQSGNNQAPEPGVRGCDPPELEVTRRHGHNRSERIETALGKMALCRRCCHAACRWWNGAMLGCIAMAKARRPTCVWRCVQFQSPMERPIGAPRSKARPFATLEIRTSGPIRPGQIDPKLFFRRSHCGVLATLPAFRTGLLPGGGVGLGRHTPQHCSGTSRKRRARWLHFGRAR